MLNKPDFVKIKALVQQLLEESEKRTKNEILKSQDKVIGRLDNIDAELAITSGDTDKLANHEDRLEKIERLHPQGKHAFQIG